MPGPVVDRLTVRDFLIYRDGCDEWLRQQSKDGGGHG